VSGTRCRRRERQDMVRMLLDEGMSSRSNAQIVGATDRTVRNYMAGGKNLPPEPTPANVNTETGNSRGPRLRRVEGRGVGAGATGLLPCTWSACSRRILWRVRRLSHYRPSGELSLLRSAWG